MTALWTGNYDGGDDSNDDNDDGNDDDDDDHDDDDDNDLCGDHDEAKVEEAAFALLPFICHTHANVLWKKERA